MAVTRQQVLAEYIQGLGFYSGQPRDEVSVCLSAYVPQFSMQRDLKRLGKRKPRQPQEIINSPHEGKTISELGVISL